MKQVVIVGGGNGADLAKIWLRQAYEILEPAAVLDDSKPSHRPTSVIASLDPRVHALLISSSEMAFRRRIYYEWPQFEFVGVYFTDPWTRVNSMGQGNWIFPDAQFGYFSRVGNNNVISSFVCINHHCTVGSSNLFGPGTMLSGRVTIGDDCTIGSNVVIEPKVKIGDRCIIPSGTVVCGDLPDDTHVKAEKSLTAGIPHGLSIYQGGRTATRARK